MSSFLCSGYLLKRSSNPFGITMDISLVKRVSFVSFAPPLSMHVLEPLSSFGLLSSNFTPGSFKHWSTTYMLASTFQQAKNIRQSFSPFKYFSQQWSSIPSICSLTVESSFSSLWLFPSQHLLYPKLLFPWPQHLLMNVASQSYTLLSQKVGDSVLGLFFQPFQPHRQMWIKRPSFV